MVLYHLSTTYQLLYCIVHRLARHEKEEAGLLMVEYICPEGKRAEFVKQLKDTGWFSFVRLVPEKQFKLKRGRSLKENSTEKQIETVIRRVCGCVKNWLGLDLSTFSRIYIGSDQWSFGMYCLYNRIPHVYIEDASGMLSQRERYMAITKEISLTNYVITEYLHGAGHSDTEIARLCDTSNFLPGFTDEKAEDFSIYRALRDEIPHRVPEILRFYGAQPVNLPPDKPVCMFMTQYIKSMAVRDLDVQEQITTLLLDYFAENYQVVIKPHPKDQWLNYRRMCPEAAILPGSVNAELIPFLVSRPVDRVLTASSTSVGGMAPTARDVFSFTTEIETNWEALHTWYAAAVVLRHLCEQIGSLAPRYDEGNITGLHNFLLEEAVPLTSDGTPVLITKDPMRFAAEKGWRVLLPTNGHSASPARARAKITVQVHPEENSLLRGLSFTLYLGAPDEEPAVPQPEEERVLSHSHAVIHMTTALYNDRPLWPGKRE